MNGRSFNTDILESKDVIWPDMPLEEWKDTYGIMHLWSQIIGKIKLEYCPHMNHWWNITFLLSAQGLTTGIIPYKGFNFEIEFDFISHLLIINTSDGRRVFLILKSGTIAEFYHAVQEKLSSLGIEIHIWPVPVEIDDRLPFDQDHRYREYNPEHAHRYWQRLIHVSHIMQLFRSGFTGKASPIHFFWGSFDLALTFFSGRPAPEHPGGPNVARRVMVESYNAELASFGFWGGNGLGEAAFYAYMYPEPDDYKKFAIEPKEAKYNDTFREFILPYNAVKNAEFPEQRVLAFYRSAFKAAEELSHWDLNLYKTSL